MNDRLTGLLGADWTGWSHFKSLTSIPPTRSSRSISRPPIGAIPGLSRADLEYEASDAWTLRAGTAYDDTPVPDSTRSPRIPDNGRFWLAAGATWHASERMDVKVSYAHLFLDGAHIHQTPALTGNDIRGTLAGTSRVNADAAGIEIAWRW